MPMRAHELHPAFVHAPLTLVPAATIVDVVAVATRDRRGGRLGSKLWGWAALSGGLAGLLGMSASRQVDADEGHASDMMWLHGVGNVALVTAAVGMWLWRRRHPPTATQASVGVVACAAAVYTAYLGGEMVYEHGVGVKVPGADLEMRASRSPAVISRNTLATTLRDAVAGLRWLTTRTIRVLTGKQRFDGEAAKMMLTEPPRAGDGAGHFETRP